MKPEQAPRLKDWMNASEVAKEFGISRQTVNGMIHNGEFKTLHISGPTDQKGQYYVKRSEVEKMKKTRVFPRSKSAQDATESV